MDDLVWILTGNPTLDQVEVDQSLGVRVDQLDVPDAVAQLLDLRVPGLQGGIDPGEQVRL